jgi:hypothetical protein
LPLADSALAAIGGQLNSFEKTGRMQMSATNSVVAIFDSYDEAEGAVKALQQAGVDMKSLSIAGRGVHTDEHVVGYYNAGDRMKYWARSEHSGVDSGGFSLNPRSLQYQALGLFS